MSHSVTTVNAYELSVPRRTGRITDKECPNRGDISRFIGAWVVGGIRYRGAVEQPNQVVFVHGFLSAPATWDRFVDLLSGDPELAGFQWRTFGYASPRFSLDPRRRIPDLDEVADSLRTYLVHDLPAGSPVVLVSHSMGGLVVQRMLARTLAEGRGRELTRIRRIVMFACPNSGSELLLLFRRWWWFWFHRQERELRPIHKAVIEAQRAVLGRVVHARDYGPDRCRIPVVAVAGESDGIVTPASALSVFPDAWIVAGDHGEVIRPDSRQHRSYTLLKAQLREPPVVDSPPAPSSSPASPSYPVPTARSRSALRPTVLTVEQYREIVEQLCRVHRITEQSVREQLYELLPAPVTRQLRRDGSAWVELLGLVRSFHRFPASLAPWDTLLAALMTIAPDDPAVSTLGSTLTRLGVLTRPPRLPADQ
jgi:pimeloyl-ACP methyl ester carboxylesterase